MNSLVATPPLPPHFYEHNRFNSASRFVVPPMNPSGSRKRKADDENSSSDYDTRMSASPTNSPALPAKPLATRQIKRARPNLSGRPLALGRLLETLDSDALRSVLRTLCDRHPELGQEVVQAAPQPNAASALQVLNNYESTLQSSFPFGGNPSSDYAYNRVRSHVIHLLEALNDFTPHFLPPNETHPSTSLEYLDGVTNIIHRLPRWDTPHYNLEKEAAYEEIAKAWTLVIREASKRGGGIQLQHGEWDQKLAKHNQSSGGKLQEAVNELRASLCWLAGNSGHPSSSGHPPTDSASIRQQLLSGTYGSGLPLKVGPW